MDDHVVNRLSHLKMMVERVSVTLLAGTFQGYPSDRPKGEAGPRAEYGVVSPAHRHGPPTNVNVGEKNECLLS